MKFSSIILSVLLVAPTLAFCIDTKDTRMLSQPTASATHVAFIYAEDLWVANLDGSQPRRITVDEGVESNPFLSPDGKWIAFSAQYDGNTDVFIVSAEGGVPTRLTWHPGADFVRGFTPDGKNVLFHNAVFSQIDTTNYLLCRYPVGFLHKLNCPTPGMEHIHRMGK
jgi:tricorn protease